MNSVLYICITKMLTIKYIVINSLFFQLYHLVWTLLIWVLLAYGMFKIQSVIYKTVLPESGWLSMDDFTED